VKLVLIEGGGVMNRAKVALVVGLATIALLNFSGARAGMASRVSIAYQSNAEDFTGRVRSGERECRVRRTVKVFRKTANGRSLQGKDKTNSRGRYRVHVMAADGRYFAVATRHEGMNNLVCERDRSQTIRV
jgi:hypothetical protein